MLAAASLSPVTVFAAENEQVLEEVIVTGSRIKRTNLVSSSPVTQIDADEFQFQGTVRVEDLVRNLPQVWSNQNTGQSNGATGTATVNLRNLGDERTLVLINGRRLPAGSPIQGGTGADLNQIPGALIERVEVLTGGASAIYGSDAVSGVVNFLLDDDFQGFRLDYQFSNYQHKNDNNKWRDIVRADGYPVPTGSDSGGDTDSLSLIIGGNFDDGRGNVTAYATWRQIDEVTQASRDYSACALSGSADFCFGSSTIPDGALRDFGGLQSYVNNIMLFVDPDTGESYVPVEVDTVDLKVAGTEFVPRDGTTFNYGPLNYFQRPDERYTFGSFARYEVNEHFEAYSELMFTDDRSESQIAPSGNFYVTDTLNCDNALLSEQQRQEICGQYLDNTPFITQLQIIRDNIGLDNDLPEDLLPHPLLGGDGVVRQAVNIGRRNVEGGNRQQDLRHTSFRLVLGGRGDINDIWRYDAFYQYSEVSMENTYMNDLSVTRITRALDVVADADGNPVCRTALPGGADLDCVPWNLFTTGGATPEALTYLTLPLFARGTTDQTVVSAYVAANLGDYGVRLPWADTGVDVAFGMEYREENLDFNPDNGFRTGDGAGQGGETPPVSGGYDVTEFFMEASIPLVEGKRAVDALTLDLSYRRSDYSYGIDTDTFGLRAAWTINDDVKLRTSFQRAIRGANVREFFRPQGFNLTDLDADPCGGPVTDGMTAEGRTLEECMRSGVTAAQFGFIANNPAGQYNYLQGGNPDLEPEESDSYSIGVVFTPQSIGVLQGLILSVDYFQIEIEKGIDNLTPEFILNECLDGNTAQCAKVRRSGAGDLWVGSDLQRSGHIVALNDNLAIEEVAGYDINAEYSIEIGRWGDLEFTNVTSIITTWDQQELAGAPTIDCKGNWGSVCGYPTPDFQNNLRVTWNTPWDIQTSLLWRYISEVDDLNSTDIDLDAIHYFDMFARWDVRENITFRVGVNNVFDKEPPVAGGASGPDNNGNGNVFPGMYDALGRYLFVGGGLEF